MDLYHSSIRLPEGFTAPSQRVSIDYGSHARSEAFADRYGKIALPATIPLSMFEVIEVGIEGGRVKKILFRGHIDSTRDLCIVLIPNANGPWFCKTVWVNLRSDLHRTLDRSKYIG